MPASVRKIAKIRSGGQSGVDRAALDFAIEHEIPYCGWCPNGGWAEDYPDPPGLLRDYPELQETPSSGTEQRTKWNMRDADAILTIIPESSAESKGTEVGLEEGEHLSKQADVHSCRAERCAGNPPMDQHAAGWDRAVCGRSQSK